MNWALIKVKQTNWIQDNSGYYVLINYIRIRCRTCKTACNNCIDGHVRLDVMDTDDMTVISFQGSASDVRKHIMQSVDQCNVWHLSFEHAAYIGYELARCELMQGLYVQD